MVAALRSDPARLRSRPTAPAEARPPEGAAHREPEAARGCVSGCLGQPDARPSSSPRDRAQARARFAADPTAGLLRQRLLAARPVGPVPGRVAEPGPAGAQAAPAPVGSHVVRPGDTLSAIGARAGVPWPTLAAYNQLQNPNLILPGQEIRLPPPGWTPAQGPAAVAPASGVLSPGVGATSSAPSAVAGPFDPTATSPARQAALDWSRAQMDPATATGVNSNNGLSASQDPKAWNNWCLAFVSTAYGRQVPELRAGAAIQSYENFRQAGKIDPSRANMPAGVPVFFDATSRNGGYGHIAIFTGRYTDAGDPIIRTSGWRGRDGITEMPLSQLEAATGPFLGWGQV